MDQKFYLAAFNHLMPFPGTPLYQRLATQGRILTRDWSLYDAKHVLLETLHLSAERIETLANELAEGLGLART